MDFAVVVNLAIHMFVKDVELHTVFVQTGSIISRNYLWQGFDIVKALLFST